MADEATATATDAATVHEVRPYDSVLQLEVDGEWLDYAAIKTKNDYKHAKRHLNKPDNYRVRTTKNGRNAKTETDAGKLRWHEDGPEPEAATAPAPGRVDPEDIRLPVGTVVEEPAASSVAATDTAPLATAKAKHYGDGYETTVQVFPGKRVVLRKQKRTMHTGPDYEPVVAAGYDEARAAANALADDTRERLSLRRAILEAAKLAAVATERGADPGDPAYAVPAGKHVVVPGASRVQKMGRRGSWVPSGAISTPDELAQVRRAMQEGTQQMRVVTTADVAGGPSDTWTHNSDELFWPGEDSSAGERDGEPAGEGGEAVPTPSLPEDFPGETAGVKIQREQVGAHPRFVVRFLDMGTAIYGHAGNIVAAPIYADGTIAHEEHAAPTPPGGDGYDRGEEIRAARQRMAWAVSVFEKATREIERNGWRA